MIKGFYGTNYHNMDKKSRVFIPATYRELLGDEFMISRNISKPCITVYPMKEWEKVEEKINSLPSSQAGDIQRFVYGGSCQTSCDSQGRVLITAVLKEHANLSGEVAVVGLSSKFELWDAEAFRKEEASQTAEQMHAVALSLNL